MRETDERMPLEPLDPGFRDPGFWVRFHSRVMADAREELTHRSLTGSLSIVTTVFYWRRTLVPLALMAAALAGILLASGGSEEMPQLVAVDEVLIEDLNLLSASGVFVGDALLREWSLMTAEEGF